MVWAKTALAGGLLVVLAAFAFGTEHHRSTLVMGHDVDCGAAISASWLVAGTPDPGLDPGPGATVEDRRAAAACSPVVRQSRVVILGAMGVGGLVALVGWTGLRGQRAGRLRQVTAVHA